MNAERPLNERTAAILRRLVRREAGPALRKVLARTRAEDIAAAMASMTWSEQRRIYRAIDDRDKAAEVLANMSDDGIRRITNEMTEELVADLLDRLEPDDATDVVHALPDDVRVRVLEEMEHEDKVELARLLAYPPDTAGGIMSTDYFTASDKTTCGAAIRALQRRTDEVENVQYVYVVDVDQRLRGVVSLRGLVVHPPNTPLVSVMTRDPITVHPSDDQEEVARFVARYDLLAIPVVEESGRMIGLVTVDDVVDVIREEAAEDMYKMAGLSENADVTGQAALWKQARRRAGWLLTTIFGGMAAAGVIGQYEATLQQVAVLAGYIPVVMAMGGNVGIQSATVAVRGLATGHVQVGGAVVFILRELRVGVLLGLLYGAIITAIVSVGMVPEEPMVGIAVGVSIFAAIASASLMGSGIPVLLSRFKIDPAVATGPIVTTLVDLLAIFIYFNIARVLLGL